MTGLVAGLVTGPVPATRRAAVVLVLVALAGVLVLVGAPPPVRLLFCLPVLVLTPGALATALVLGRRSRGNVLGDDRMLRGGLTVVLGVLLLLAVVLLVAVLGVPLTTIPVVLGLVALDVVLLLLQRLPGVPLPRSPQRPLPPVPLPSPRTVAAVLTVAALLIGAIAVARAMRPEPVDRYTLVRLDGPTAGSAPRTVRPGAPVAVPVTISSVGYVLDARRPTVTVDLGRESRTARTHWDDIVAGGGPVGSPTSRHGTITFAAPRTPGLYSVQLSTRVPADPTPDSLLLTVPLEVTA